MPFNSLHAIFITLLISLSAAGYGLHVLAFWSKQPLLKSASLSLMLAFGLGTGILSLSTLFLGLTGMLAFPFVILLLVGGLLSGGPLFYRQFLESYAECRAFFRKIGPYKLCIAVIAGLAILNGLAALAPPLDTDVLNYHLAAPHIYVQQQRIIPIPGIYHSYFPFNIQMLYTLCLIFKAPLAAQCLHVTFGFGNLLLIGGIASYFYGPKTAALAAALFYSITDVGGETPLARIDLGVSFYALLAFLCLLKAQEEKEHQARLLILAGIFGGLCAGSKYTALIVPALLVMHILTFLPESPQRKLKLALLAAFIAMVFASPWYLRNYFWTGNPVYPFLAGSFGKGPLTEEALSHIQQGNWNYAPIPRTLKNFALTPWLLLVQREAFSSNRLGPLFLSYLPLFFLLRRHRLKPLFPLLLFCLLWAPFWFWTSPLIRFLFAPLGLLCIILAQSIRLTLRYNVFWRVLTLNFLALWLTFALGWNMKYHVPLAAVAMGIQSPENFLGRHGNIEGYQYADFEYVNTKLKPERLLLFGSNGLYIQAPFVLATDWTSRHWAEIRHCDAQTMITVFHVDRITHIMTRESLQNGHSTESTGYRCWKTIQDALGASPVYTEGTTQIFSLPRE